MNEGIKIKKLHRNREGVWGGFWFWIFLFIFSKIKAYSSLFWQFLLLYNKEVMKKIFICMCTNWYVCFLSNITKI